MKKFIFFAAAFIVVVGVASFLLWSRQPARGTIVQSDPVGTEVKGSSSALEDFSTGLFSTRITANLKIKNKNEVPSPSILGQYLLSDKDVYVSDQLAITVGVAKNNAISEVSPVKFRRTFPESYEEVLTEVGFPQGSVVFVKKTDFEKAVFWAQDGKYVAAVVSGGIENRAELENSLRAVVTNWQWL